jgi:hypothetical protein
MGCWCRQHALVDAALGAWREALRARFGKLRPGTTAAHMELVRNLRPRMMSLFGHRCGVGS